MTWKVGTIESRNTVGTKAVGLCTQSFLENQSSMGQFPVNISCDISNLFFKVCFGSQKFITVACNRDPGFFDEQKLIFVPTCSLSRGLSGNVNLKIRPSGDFWVRTRFKILDLNSTKNGHKTPQNWWKFKFDPRIRYLLKISIFNIKINFRLTATSQKIKILGQKRQNIKEKVQF